jgi:hypothetical protein
MSRHKKSRKNTASGQKRIFKTGEIRDTAYTSTLLSSARGVASQDD